MLPALLRPRPARPPHVARLVGCDWTRLGRHGAPGLRPSTHALRREGLARDVLYDRDGALAYERDGHRVGADALAGGQNGPMTLSQLVDLGVVLVGLVVAILLAVFLGLGMKGNTRRSRQRGRR